MARAHKKAEAAAREAPEAPLPKMESPIVPHQSIGGRALVAVVSFYSLVSASQS